jgi:hypothetical protein
MTSLYQSEIGKVLKTAREELYISLQQASVALHIRAHYLQALETGKLEDLPGAAYIRGYLQSYAIFLHLDKDEMLRRFDIIESDIPEKGLFFPQVFSKDKKPSSSVVWSGISLVILIYGVWFLLFRQASAPPIVDPLPYYKSGIVEFPVSNYTFNLACARPSHRVYPACYRADMHKLVENSPLSLRHRKHSVMDIAVMGLVN